MQMGQKNFFIYPKNQSLDKVWFVKYIPADTNKPLKIQIPNLNSVEQRITFANKISVDIQTNGYKNSHSKAFCPTSKILEMLNDVLNRKKARISLKKN
jgi:hypothetical protein